MESWEKEYLEIISVRKAQTPAGGEPQCEHINEGWEEITRPDGSKWYIPKQKVLRRQQRRLNRQRRRRARCFSLVKKGLLAILVVCCLAGFLFKTGSDFSTEKRGTIGASIGLFDSLRFPGSYVNGRGLVNMVDVLSDILNTHIETLNAFNSDKYSWNESELDSWLGNVDADLVAIEELRYDDSYTEYVDIHRTLLNILHDYILFCREGDFVSAQVSLVGFSSLVPEVSSVLTAALDKNGVDYLINDDGTLMISYLKY